MTLFNNAIILTMIHKKSHKKTKHHNYKTPELIVTDAELNGHVWPNNIPGIENFVERLANEG